MTQAALINGAASHVSDYDDTTTVDIRHASVGLFPGVLALAEERNATGKDFVAASLVGYKTAMLMGFLAGRAQYDSGWHTTSTIGRIAAAAGAARLLRLDEDRAIYAIGLAGTMSAGMKIVFGTMAKSFHAGNASKDGLIAALLAEEGLNCSENFYEGPDGYLQVFRGAVDESEMANLGKTWDFDRLAQKYHASCHFTHSAIEAASAAIDETGLQIDDINEIIVYSSQLALNAAGKLDPRTALEGKFSLPYCVATALLRKDTGLGAFTDEKVSDPLVRTLMHNIRLVLDKSLAPMEVRVVVMSKGCAMVEKRIDVFREIPPTDEKRRCIEQRFRDIANQYGVGGHSDSIIGTVRAIETAQSMRSFIDAIDF